MKTDVISGVLAIAIGGAVALLSLQYTVGSLAFMGTGYFPLMLSLLLVLLGVILIVGGVGQTSIKLSMPPLRATGFILLAPVAFGALVTRVGLVAAVIAVAALGAFALKEGSVVEKVATVTGVTAVALLVFRWGLGLPIPLFQWELG